MGAVKVSLYRRGDVWDVPAYDAVASPLLDADPVRHTLAETVLDHLRHGAVPARLLTVSRKGRIVGAASRIEGRPLLVSGLPPAYAVAADEASADLDPEPGGAAGPVAEVEAYAAAFRARTGRQATTVMRQRLFQLVSLCSPRGVAGRARTAGPDDLDLLVRWQDEFRAEAFGPRHRGADSAERSRLALAQSIAEGNGHLLWEADGAPVAYAQARHPVAGMSRIGPVYTPREHRGHGHGTAVTAAAAAWAQQVGAREVVLFTDLANPVSNAIYPRIGFCPVEDTLEVALPAATP